MMVFRPAFGMVMGPRGGGGGVVECAIPDPVRVDEIGRGETPRAKKLCAQSRLSCEKRLLWSCYGPTVAQALFLVVVQRGKLRMRHCSAAEQGYLCTYLRHGHRPRLPAYHHGWAKKKKKKKLGSELSCERATGRNNRQPSAPLDFFPPSPFATERLVSLSISSSSSFPLFSQLRKRGILRTKDGV